MVRAVLDTNIWISAIVFKGKLSLLIDHWEDKKFDACFSQYTFEEFQEKLLLWGKMLNREEDMLQQILILKAKSLFVYPQRHFTICEDPDDNIFLDAAVEGKVDYLVSGDKKVQKLKRIENVLIVSPKEFLDIIAT